MDQHSKSELIKSYRKRYGRCRKSEKSEIINRVVEATGYSRKHVIRAMNRELDVPKRIRRKKGWKYAHLYELLKKVWAAANFVCGKRLQPFLPEFVKSLKRHGEITLCTEDEALLLTASAATIDRLLGPARKGMSFKGRSTTKPGTLLKQSIAIRTFADWDQDRPGFLEIDLVAHCGDTVAGDYVNTLDMTDICTGWTICTAFMGKSERFCVEAIEATTPLFPFPIVGIDSDNGGEFINAHLKRYCERRSITFTRARPRKKNDSAHIEQKNWDVVRKMIGYGRFETKRELAIVRRIHEVMALYQNYFQPSRKRTSKLWNGAKVTKTYDIAQTPMQRLLARKDTPPSVKKLLRGTFREINPAECLRTVNDLIDELYSAKAR